MNKLLYCFIFMLLPGIAAAREQIRVVGSSTVFPFVAAAAEQFGHTGKFRTPIVEATGTGGGIKMFCEGVGDHFPDMVNASRAIKPSEIEQCAKHGVTTPAELAIGYDGIVLANALNSPSFALSKKTLFLALAREVPRAGKMVMNPFTRWRQIDPALPDVSIAVYGPPPTSGTRDAFSDLVMLEGCKQAAPALDESQRKQFCTAMREDGHFIEAGEDDNLIVQKLINNTDALGVFGYSFLETNAALVKANSINGILPTFEGIIRGDYTVARSLYVYVKTQHLGQVPGLAQFAQTLVSDAAAGEDGYLMVKGLLPLPKPEHETMKQRAARLKPN